MRTNWRLKGQVSMFVIIAIVLVAAIVLIAVLLSGEAPEEIEFDCEVDLDCVPDECCSAANCVPVGEALNCKDVGCVPGCESSESGLLECGEPSVRGFCGCVNNKCTPVYPELEN